MHPIESPRLRLRLFEPEDAPLLDDLYSDPEVMRFLPIGTPPPAGSSQVAKFRARFEESGFTLWAAERKEDGDFLGRIGLWPLEDTGEVEIAYVIPKRHWGVGYATEAAAACVQFGFARCGLESIAAIADPGNGASLRVMEKVGFTFVREDRFYGIDVRYHQIHRENWEQRR